MVVIMPWSDSPDYERPIRVRDILGIIGLLLVLLLAYELTPALHRSSPETLPAARTR